MTVATTQSTPAVPPRPSRNSDKETSSSGPVPKIPPRPSRRPERSLSPNADRFAPSPLNEAILAKPLSKTGHLSPHRASFEQAEEPAGRPGSVPMPSVGEEGMEYSAVFDEIAKENNDEEDRAASPVAPPEQTRTVAHDLKLHAPKPSLPADSAKQRVMAVTRTDSDKAASYGIGRPSLEGRTVSFDGAKKRSSTSFSASSDHGLPIDDEAGIPEIGQRVPMNPDLGDVQAPSPGPSEASDRHHTRKHSSRSHLPGSYGLHGHGVLPQDKLEREYYKKHPELLKREENTPIHDRQNDYALSSTELNRLVRDTRNRGAGQGTSPEYRGTPTDEVAFQASEEYARMSSPRPGSAAKKEGHRRSSSLAKVMSKASEVSTPEPEEGVIHVDDAKHPEYRSYGDEDPIADEEDDYTAPILAPDEAQKDTHPYPQQPAIRPRRASNYESEESLSRPTSRSLMHHNNTSQPEIRNTPLEDVEEYEPLFPEDGKEKKEKPPTEPADENRQSHHFPSKDIWEDAPSSVHYTATVSTPEPAQTEHHRTRSSGHHADRPITPAHAFAQHQEALAEREAKRRSSGNNDFLPWSEAKPMWVPNPAHLKVERTSSGPRFPSRDIWEDAPESQLHQTVISSPEEEEERKEEEGKKPEVPSQPAKRSSDSSERPAIPTRPKPKQASSDDAKPRPPVSDKPKPQIPARPTKSSSGEAKEKPPVPSRPVGGKIAALQAGFMSDLNQRLKIGPQIHKKEEPSEKEPAEEKQKVPLSDARKGRARGPQRRAPAKSPAPPAEPAKPSAPVLSISLPQSSWSIDPEEGSVVVGGAEKAEEQQPPTQGPTGEDAPKSEPKSLPEPVEPTKTEAAEPAEPPADATEKTEEAAEEPKTEDKKELTLARNMAGEALLEATVEKPEAEDKVHDGDEVEVVDTKDEVKT